jgi:TetR/AcrR family transcriptional regulator, regulator of cefoperazone and chloramphenicol sensitivity
VEQTTKKNWDTKARLIEAAGEVFSKHGFRSATVREICRLAGTPLGAINYHFRDKKGLYAAVLEHSLQSAVGKYPPDFGLRERASPEEKLRAFVHSFLLRLFDEGIPAWHMKIWNLELSDPTGVLDQLVDNSILPLYRYLLGILFELLRQRKPAEGKESMEVFLCAMSIVGQCHHLFTARQVFGVLHPKGFDPVDIDLLTDHITWFSLEGIRKFSKKNIRIDKLERNKSR